jgi:predicted lipid-binding transport protein (Tim44 family)
MKLSSTKVRTIRGGASGSLAVLVTFLLRYLLAIPSKPFDMGSGWRVIVGWLIVLAALTSLFEAIIRFFRPISHQHGPDAYTLAQAEIQAERTVKLSQSDEQQPKPRNA